MLTMFRDGFSKDLVVLVLVSIILGSLLSGGIAYAIDSYFGDTIDGLIGEYGEYDAILHFREEAKQAGIEELKRLIDERFSGARFKVGLTIAGQANVFLSLPDDLKTKEVLSNFSSYFGDLPGSSGYTLMVEPSVVVRGVNPAVRSRLLREIERVDGVRFAFHNGTSIYAVLESESMNSNKNVSQAIEKLLKNYQIVEVRFPMGYAVDDPTSVAADVALDLKKKYDLKTVEDISLAGEGEEYQSFIKTLTEMKRFLLSYASKVEIDVAGDAPLHVGTRLVLVPAGQQPLTAGKKIAGNAVVAEIQIVRGGDARGLIVKGEVPYESLASNFTAYKLTTGDEVGPVVGQAKVVNERFRLLQATQESISLLTELDGLAADANTTVEGAQKTLETFQAALTQLNDLQQQIALLQQSLLGRTNNNLFFDLLMKQLVSELFEGEDGKGLAALKNLDVASMQSNLAEVASRISAIDTVKVETIIEEIERVQESLPDLKDEEISHSIALIDRYISGQVIPGERIALLVDGSLPVKQAEKVIKEATDNKHASVFTTPVGVVNLDARAELVRVLREVRAIIAGLLALVVTILFLILDHAAVLSTLKHLLRERKGTEWWRRFADPVKVFGAAVGAVLFVGIYVLSRARIPMLGVGHIFIIGALLGLGIAALADRFSPINLDEVMAGEALGLPYVQIMREIVIPAGRPGLMNLINRTKQQFK